jgi:hypothetical protein
MKFHRVRKSNEPTGGGSTLEGKEEIIDIFGTGPKWQPNHFAS